MNWVANPRSEQPFFIIIFVASLQALPAFSFLPYNIPNTIVNVATLVRKHNVNRSDIYPDYRPYVATALRMSSGGHKGGGGGGGSAFSKDSSPRAPPSPSKNKDLSMVQFEMQEMRANLDEMVKRGLSSSTVTLEKRNEIEGYVKSIVQKSSTSPVPLVSLSSDERILGTWRLGFSTEAATLGVLPKEARVFIKILTMPNNLTGEGRLDYVLKFTEKVMGLRGITAKSRYTIESKPPSPGLLTFVYEEITSDMFGMTLPVGLFGLLKGRANYIETVYFDGSYWIERGYTPEGAEWFNVYFKDKKQDL